MTKTEFSFICEEIYEELGNGDAKYGKFDGPQDGLGTIRCEVEELAREVNREFKEPHREKAEAIQIAAMAIKFLRDCNNAW